MDISILDASWDLAATYLTPIQALLDDDQYSDIAINRFNTIFAYGPNGWEAADAKFESEVHLVATLKQIAIALDLDFSEKNPFFDARLQDGSRVGASLGAFSPDGTSLNIRKPPRVRITMDDVVKSESMTADMASYLRLAVAAHYTILVSGGTGSGKTTLTNILIGCIPKNERVLTVDDTLELIVPNNPNAVRFEVPSAKRTNKDQNTATFADVIKHTLRRFPDRVAVGEIRDSGAASAFLNVVNTGHPGAISTIHANSGIGALNRLTDLISETAATKPFDAIRRDVFSRIDCVVQVEMTPRHGRRIVEIAETDGEGACFTLWKFNYLTGLHEKTERNSRLARAAEKYKG